MNRTRLVHGVVLVALGVVLLLDRAGTVDAWPLLSRGWPLAVVFTGVAHLVTAPRNVTGGLVTAAVGVALLAWTVDVVDSITLLWPLLLITVGLVLLSRRRREPPAPEPLVATELVAVFDDRSVRVPTGPLDLSSIVAVFADADVDLRAADIGSRARLDVTSVLGDVDVEVLPTWKVTVTGPELLGRVRVDTGIHGLPEDAPVLELKATALVGNIRVRATADVASMEPA